MTTITAPTHRTSDFGAAVSSEWTKLWSVRSTWWSLAGALALMLLLAVSFGFDVSHPPEGVTRAEVLFPVLQAATLGMVLTQFAFIALATLTVTGEYASGSILSTLQWEPRRARVLLAKVVVIAPIVLIASTAMMLLSALATDLTAGDYGVLVMSDVVEVSVRTGVYVAIAAVLAIGVGFLLRSTAGTLTVLFLLLMLLPMMLGPLDLPVLSTIGDHLPGSSGLHFAGAAHMIGLGELPYSATTGLFVFLAWAVAAVGGGLAVLRRRDV